MAQFVPQTTQKDKSDPHFIKFAGRGEKEIKVYRVEEYNAATGLTYLSELEFQDEKILRRIQMQCSKALENGSIGMESRWLGALHAKELESHSVADVSIRWIDETIGYGLFAEKEIRAWEYIGEYTGVVRKRNLIFKNFNDYCFAYPASLFSFRKHMIDAEDKGNELCYANHSDSPNSESMGVLFDNMYHIILRAIKDIPASAQITYNYWGYFWFNRRRKQRAR